MRPFDTVGTFNDRLEKFLLYYSRAEGTGSASENS